jgi:hypothetical protein
MVSALVIQQGFVVGSEAAVFDLHHHHRAVGDVNALGHAS